MSNATQTRPAKVPIGRSRKLCNLVEEPIPFLHLPETTPYALMNKTKPSLAMAHEFGITVYVHTTTGGKLEA
jgi:hypothetical protein